MTLLLSFIDIVAATNESTIRVHEFLYALRPFRRCGALRHVEGMDSGQAAAGWDEMGFARVRSCVFEVPLAIRSPSYVDVDAPCVPQSINDTTMCCELDAVRTMQRHVQGRWTTYKTGRFTLIPRHPLSLSLI